MADHTQDLKNNINRLGKVLLKQDQPLHPHTIKTDLQGNRMNIKQSQAINLLQSRATTLIPSHSTFSSALNGAQVDIHVTKGSIKGDIIKNMFVRLDITNDQESGNIKLQPNFGYAAWNYIEICYQGVVWQKIYDHQFIVDHEIQPRQTWERLGGLINMSNDYGDPDDVIADNGTRSYIIPFPQSIFDQTNLNVSNLRDDFIVKFYFKDMANNMLTGSNPPTINTFELEIEGSYVSDYHRQLSRRNHRTIPHDYRYFENLESPHIQTMSAGGSDYQIRLNGIQGYINSLYFFVRVNGASAANQLNWEPVKEWEILSANGHNMFGGSKLRHNEQFYYDLSLYDSDLSKYLFVYKIDFSDAPVIDKSLATSHGGVYFSSEERLVISLDAARTDKVETFTEANTRTPDAGSYRFVYVPKDLRDKGSEYTDWLAFDDNAAAIATAIEGLPSFVKYNQQVTANQALGDGTSITVTYGDGRLQKNDPKGRLYIEAAPDLADTGVGEAYYDSAITTDYVRGAPSGSNTYDVYVYAKKLQKLRIKPNGEVERHQS